MYLEYLYETYNWQYPSNIKRGNFEFTMVLSKRSNFWNKKTQTQSLDSNCFFFGRFLGTSFIGIFNINVWLNLYTLKIYHSFLCVMITRILSEMFPTTSGNSLLKHREKIAYISYFGTTKYIQITNSYSLRDNKK